MIYGNHDIEIERVTPAYRKKHLGSRNAYILTRSSAKIIKGEKLGYITGVCYLRSFRKIGGINTCSHAKLANCWKPCLENSGKMSLPTAIKARENRLNLLFKNPQAFFSILLADIEKIERKAKKQGMGTAYRLNGTSDLEWNRILINGKSIFELLPDLIWYDYTKNPKIAETYRKMGLSCTLSWYPKLDPESVCNHLDQGGNLAIAYHGKRLPDTQTIGDRVYRVIDGDISDLRFLDDQGVVVGLRYKYATGKNSKEINQLAKKSEFIKYIETPIV